MAGNEGPSRGNYDALVEREKCILALLGQVLALQDEAYWREVARLIETRYGALAARMRAIQVSLRSCKGSDEPFHAVTNPHSLPQQYAMEQKQAVAERFASWDHSGNPYRWLSSLFQAAALRACASVCYEDLVEPWLWPLLAARDVPPPPVHSLVEALSAPFPRIPESNERKVKVAPKKKKQGAAKKAGKSPPKRKGRRPRLAS